MLTDLMTGYQELASSQYIAFAGGVGYLLYDGPYFLGTMVGFVGVSNFGNPTPRYRYE